jgi:hypothetical protein
VYDVEGDGLETVGLFADCVDIREVRWVQGQALLGVGFELSVLFTIGVSEVTSEYQRDILGPFIRDATLSIAVISRTTPTASFRITDDGEGCVEVNDFPSFVFCPSKGQSEVIVTFDSNPSAGGFQRPALQRIWAIDGVNLSTSEIAITVPLTIGTHVIRLTVFSETGESHSLELRDVTVVPGPCGCNT